MMKKFFFTALSLFITLAGFSQQQPAMADTLRSEGKIYVVVIMIVLILAGLIGYLFLVDKKVTRLEKELKQRNPSAR